MPSVSLYRKYRPGKWSEVIGQEPIVTSLRNSIEGGNISHAYLFAGSRGTGKTSIARILAKEIGTVPADLYEIDAASNRGIEEIRELREAVKSLPFESKYKVYIVDEVHMLTTPAFNALLKTLEEPPTHVVFVLATTELDKIPDTIKSRCQIYAFRRPSEADITKYLTFVTGEEGYKADAGSLSLISVLSDGAFRDSLTILEKVLTSSKNKEIKVRDVEKITGAPSSILVDQFIEAMLAGDKSKALGVIGEAMDADTDMHVFIKLLLRSSRGALFIVFAPDLREKVREEVSEAEFKFLEELGKRDGVKKLPTLLRILLKAEKEMAYTYISSLPLELAVVEGLT
ncbi:MAG TPA: DNA polymerase III subunit gamma/tau [Candidatus Paceibacterota bacterium]